MTAESSGLSVFAIACDVKWITENRSGAAALKAAGDARSPSSTDTDPAANDLRTALISAAA